MQFKSLTPVNFATPPTESKNPLNETSAMLLFMNIQLHTFHWQTFGYPIHKTLGDLYDAVGDFADDFVESGMGIYGRPSVSEADNKLQDYSDEALSSYIDSCITYLKGLSNVYTNDTDLLNLRDSILGEFNKAKYLLTLK